jgi:polysaccharide biosynthesis protein PelD
MLPVPVPSEPATASSVEKKSPLWFLGIRRSALVEMTVLLSCLTVFDQLFFASSPAPYLIHPYWIALFLITIQYGLAETVACALLSSLFLVFCHLPGQAMTQTFYDYIREVTALPFLWVGFALIAGPLRSRQIHEREQLRQSVAMAQEKEKNIIARYKQACSIKEKLETRLAQEKGGLVTAYRTAQYMQTLREEEVFEGLKNAVVSLVNPEQFSFFVVRKHNLNCLFSKGWQKPNTNYALRFGPSAPLYRKVVARKETLCLLRPEDEMHLGEEGMLAVPIHDIDNGRVYGLLKIESVAFTEMTFHTVERCRLLGQWAGKAITNARLYRQFEKWVPDSAKRTVQDDAADETDLAAETEDSDRAGHAKSAA